jgi:plasmid stability protein
MVVMNTTHKRDVVTVKAPRDLIEQLRVLARLHNRSMSGELRTALEEYLRSHRRQIRGGKQDGGE